MLISEYLHRAASAAFAYGQFDCQLYLADWVQDQRGFDPATTWRGQYSDASTAQEIVDAHGGYYGLMSDGIAGRLDEVDVADARPGDIALVNARISRIEMGAIRTAIGWSVLKDGGGLWTARHAPMTVWRI